MALVFSLATAIVSDDLAGAQIDLNPHFTFDKTEVAVGEFVTFTNLTKGGIIPYTKAEWDFDGDDDIDITCEKDDPSNPEPMDTVYWAYTESGIYKPMLRMTDGASAVGREKAHFPPITVLYELTPAPPPPIGVCFIATAAYGTSTAKELDTLRAFRDEVLLQNSLGSQLVALYYEVSPPVADFISEHEWLRTLVRELLVDPVAWLVEATGTLWRD